jgi:uncharacterized protein (DUF2235 family)
MYGLIRPGNETLVPYVIRMMMAIQRSSQDAAQAFRATMATDCTPWFVGVWDTVSSVGWIDNPLKLPYITNNPDIQIGRHVIAIDERRAFFRSHLWRPPKDLQLDQGLKDLMQVWFPGVHCDVGGGYVERESGLSKLALEWMLNEATKFGLLVDHGKVEEMLGRIPGSPYAAPDADAAVHESLNGAWAIAEFVLKKHYNWAAGRDERRMNLFRRRTIPEKAQWFMNLLTCATKITRTGYLDRRLE